MKLALVGALSWLTVVTSVAVQIGSEPQPYPEATKPVASEDLGRTGDVTGTPFIFFVFRENTEQPAHA